MLFFSEGGMLWQLTAWWLGRSKAYRMVSQANLWYAEHSWQQDVCILRRAWFLNRKEIISVMKKSFVTMEDDRETVSRTLLIHSLGYISAWLGTDWYFRDLKHSTLSRAAVTDEQTCSSPPTEWLLYIPQRTLRIVTLWVTLEDGLLLSEGDAVAVGKLWIQQTLFLQFCHLLLQNRVILA